MFCSACGSAVKEGARFCGACGSAVDAEVSPGAAASPAAPDTAGLPATAGPQPTRRKRALIAVGVSLAAVLLAAALVYVVAGRQSDGGAPAAAGAPQSKLDLTFALSGGQPSASVGGSLGSRPVTLAVDYRQQTVSGSIGSAALDLRRVILDTSSNPSGPPVWGTYTGTVGDSDVSLDVLQGDESGDFGGNGPVTYASKVQGTLGSTRLEATGGLTMSQDSGYVDVSFTLSGTYGDEPFSLKVTPTFGPTVQLHMTGRLGAGGRLDLALISDGDDLGASGWRGETEIESTEIICKGSVSGDPLLVDSLIGTLAFFEASLDPAYYSDWYYGE